MINIRGAALLLHIEFWYFLLALLLIGSLVVAIIDYFEKLTKHHD